MGTVPRWKRGALRGFCPATLLLALAACGEPVLPERPGTFGEPGVQRMVGVDLRELSRSHRFARIGAGASAETAREALARGGAPGGEATPLSEPYAVPCLLNPGTYAIVDAKTQKVVGILIVYPDCRTEIVPAESTV